MLRAGEHVEGRDFADLVAAGGKDLFEVPQQDLQVASQIKDILSHILLG